MHRDDSVSSDSAHLPQPPTLATHYAVSVFITAAPDWATTIRAQARVWSNGSWDIEFADGERISGEATGGEPLARLLTLLAAAA